MPFRLLNLQRNPQDKGRSDPDWAADESAGNGLSLLQAILIVLAALLGIGGAAVGVFALRSSHSHSVGSAVYPAVKTSSTAMPSHDMAEPVDGASGVTPGAVAG